MQDSALLADQNWTGNIVPNFPESVSVQVFPDVLLVISALCWRGGEPLLSISMQVMLNKNLVVLVMFPVLVG